MKQDIKSDFVFPIIAYKGQILFFARNTAEIKTCTSRGLRSGFYNNLIIVDSSGKKCKIKEAIKTGYPSLFWGFNLSKGQVIKIELVTNTCTESSLDRLKDKILSAFKKDEYFWNSDGELNSKVSNIKKANNHLELITYLSNYFYSRQ